MKKWRLNRDARSGKVPASREGWNGMRKIFWSVGLAFALAAFAPADGFAECEGDNRVSHSDADCLSAQWTDSVSGGRSRISIRNDCPSLGQMDVLTVYDNMLTSMVLLTGTGWTTQLGMHRSNVDDVYCCKDLAGGFCDRVDVLTDAWCIAEFNKSPAASTCTATSITADIEREECLVGAECTHDNQSTVLSTLPVDMLVTAELRACEGWLRAEAC